MKTDALETKKADAAKARQHNGQGAAVADEQASFAETAMRLGGKSEDEARRMGAMDKADEQVEDLFQYKTTASPVHRAVWDAQLPTELFVSRTVSPSPEVAKVMDDSIDTVRRHREARTLTNDEGKIREEVLRELGSVGYWGLLVDKQYGGSGAPFATFASFLTRMSLVDGTVAGLASVHGCIGAVDPVRTFANPEQKQRFLPKLASGERLSAFALTEPCAGSDLTALRTTARLDGKEYVVDGEKLFITNVLPGRTIGLVCLIDGRPAVLVVDLPEQENDQFQLRKYGLYAIRGAYNRGIIFRGLRVPAENLLRPKRGDGLTIAYHGLNLGRVALCANASGMMRLMLASMIPWAQYRKTYGQKIVMRELVQKRLACTAGYIVACDAMAEWCAGLLDQHYRGEMECMVAKIFGSESQKHVAIEYFMKTHGGRSFLHGHLFGDQVHEFLAPCIYEGEGEMLGMGLFKSLFKHHGTQLVEPIGHAMMAAGIAKPNLTNPKHLWALRRPGMSYAKWFIGQKLHRTSYTSLPAMPAKLRDHAEFAANVLQKAPLEISAAFRKHQLALADRQCRMSELSQRVQDATVILCTSLYASRQQDELVRDAADIICQDLTRRITGRRPSDAYFRSAVRLGKAIADGGFKSIAGLHPDEILMPYEDR